MVWALGALLCLATTPGHADEDTDPASRVARISYLKGPVYVQTQDDENSTEARINRPLTSGDQVWTDNRGRAELQMGSTAIQVDADTQLRLLELSDDVLQLQVTQGVVNVRVRSLGKGDTVEIDTPNAAVSIMEPGTYRIGVAEQEELTVVGVREGSADVAGERRSFTLRADEQLTLRGNSRLAAEFDDLGRMDDFDRWATQRNQRAERVASARYVSPEVIGYEDLDDYGYWRWYNDYGYVWMPTRIVSGWTPYRDGHWAWVSPWGWTWIDNAPWGFAPFHYGRWTTIGSRWCWVPGPRSLRPVYAPALVAWIGTPGVSVSIGVGSYPVGWIPLGPREVYRPVYRSSHNYIVKVNRSNSLLNDAEFERGYRRQPHEDTFLNRRATSVVTADSLRNARPVKDQLIRSENLHLQPVAGTPVARPERGEGIGNPPSGMTQRPVRREAPPIAENSREVLARRQPTAPAATARQFDRVRVIDRPVALPNSNDTGRSVELRSDQPANARDNWRESRRSQERRNDDSPASRSSRSITTPYLPPESSNESSNRSPPNAPEIMPPAGRPEAGEPRARSNPWGRGEQRSNDRERDQGGGNYMPAPSVERERSRSAPYIPPSQRNEPAPQTPAPMQPSRSPDNAESNRDGGTIRSRGPRGDLR